MTVGVIVRVIVRVTVRVIVRVTVHVTVPLTMTMMMVIMQYLVHRWGSTVLVCVSNCCSWNRSERSEKCGDSLPAILLYTCTDGIHRWPSLLCKLPYCLHL